MNKPFKPKEKFSKYSRISNTPKTKEALERIYECKTNKSNRLSLGRLNLTELPQELFELTFLEYLDLKSNPLKSLDTKIGNLSALIELELDDADFSELPDSFSNLKLLKVLRLGSESIISFPKQLLSLKNIERINIGSCNISELPSELNNLENLKSLWLLRNPISRLDHLQNVLSRLEALSVNGTNISDYKFLEKLHKIESISIGGRDDIKEIPLQIFELKTLRRFHVSSTAIESIPSEIGKLQNLVELSLFECKINFIPESIGNLRNLSEVWIVSQQLSSLPKSFGNLTNLKHLSIYNNNFSEFPVEICNLNNLVKLDVHSNKISSIPNGIGNLSNLETLNLSFNDLSVLPLELHKLSKLINLSLQSNKPLISPPKHTVEKGTEAVLSYLKDLIEEVKVWSSKLVIVGEGRVGKSCLFDSLKGIPFEIGKLTTHALNLGTLDFNHPSANCQMQLKVWDFGGQDIYHATHQFYLTNHSLFLLVWSAGSGYDAGKIYKWLETISALAPDSPIFIVATNSGPRGADLPKGDIINLYPDKVFFFEVDNKERSGIEELKEAIRVKASELKYMGVGRPKSWINSSKEIQNTNGKYLSKQELFNIFYKNGVSKESYDSLAVYLHDLGEILYYPDQEELNNTIIIKPEWVSKQIAKILDSDALTKNEGFLNKKLLQELWHDIDSPMHEKLITLMEKFDLSYRTIDDKEISLIVEKLKYEEHENYHSMWSSFEGRNEIVFKYQLDSIPAGIPTWFIARTHRFSTRTHWKFGALLKDEFGKHLGLIIASPERKEIWLRVKGEMPHYFFAQLRDTLELTFNRFEGLKRPIFVPCPCNKNNKPCSHFFELDDLENRLSIETPKQTIECPKSLIDVEVMRLVFGISFAPYNEALVEKIRGEMEKVIREQNKIQTEELVKLAQLDFVKSYQVAQKIADITCPNTFTLKKIESNIKGISLKDKYKLQLYCQMPGCNHPIGDAYDMEIANEWVQAIAPYYNKMLSVLKYTIPLAIPIAKMNLEEAEFDVAKHNLDSVKDYIKLGDKWEDSIDLGDSPEMPIRQIRNLLDNVDPQNNWAGLKRIVSPEGHILWLCKEHFAVYKK